MHAECAGVSGPGYYAAGPRLDVQDVPAKLQPSCTSAPPSPKNRACGSVPAHGSSKPRGRRWLKRWFPALAGVEPALAGSMDEAGLVTVR